MIKVLRTCLVVSMTALFIVLASTPVKAQDDKDVRIQQLEANLRLYDEALRELEAPTPIETALVYAKGIRTRNGVMQYSVLSNKFKEEFKKNMVREIWVTGVSSPWVSHYEIISEKRTKGEHKIIIKFNWATSTGPAGDTKTELTIAKEDGKWRITNIKNINQ